MDHPVLVTGASGFIGRHLVARLLAEGRRVRALVRTAEAARAMATLGAEPVIDDLSAPAQLDVATAGVRTVYHLAGRLYVPGTPAETYERLHVGGTRALMSACGRSQVQRFVLCTTTGVLGTTGARPADEDDYGQRQNAYEETKARAEDVARTIAAQDGVPLAIARPSLVYGPGDLHLLGWFRAIRGGYYRVIGSGANRVHPIFIDDLIAGLLLTARQGGADGRAYNLVGSRPVTMREMGDAIGRAVGRGVPARRVPAGIALAVGAVLETLPVARHRLPLTRARVRFMTQERAYDGTRARVELGFIPGVDLNAGLASTVEWYRARGLLS